MEKKIFEVLTIFLMCLTIIKSEEFKTEHRCQHPAQDEGRVDGGHEDERYMEAGYIDESLNAFDQVSGRPLMTSCNKEWYFDMIIEPQDPGHNKAYEYRHKISQAQTSFKDQPWAKCF